MVARGEVWWNDDPETGRRPYLILSRDDVIPFLRQVIAIPATQSARGIPSEIPLSREDGMSRKCVLVADSMTLIHKSLCTKRITSLSPQKMTEVCFAVRVATSCY